MPKKALPTLSPHWRDTAHALVVGTRRNLTWKKEMSRILDHPDASTALTYMADANGGKEDIEYLVDLVDVCVLGIVGCSKRISRRKAAKIADSLRFALRDCHIIYRDPILQKGVRRAADQYAMLAEGHPGRPTSPSLMVTINLRSLLESRYGRPVWEAIAALMRATYPDKAFDTNTVKGSIRSRANR